MKISVIGLGAMGLPMATRLAEKYQVTGVDTNPERTKLGKEAGLQIAPNAQAAAAQADAVLIAVRNQAQLESLLFGGAGSAPGASPANAPSAPGNTAGVSQTNAKAATVEANRASVAGEANASGGTDSASGVSNTAATDGTNGAGKPSVPGNTAGTGGASPANDANRAGGASAPDEAAGAGATRDAGSLGIATAMKPGSFILLTSTIGIAPVEEVAAKLNQQGIGLIDAPVSGGPLRAGKGDLLIVAGAYPKVWEQGKRVLEHLASTLVYVGAAPGKGQSLKTVNQLLCGVHIAAAGEALALAKELGLDQQATLDALMAGAAASFMLGDRGPRAIEASEGAKAEVRSRLDIFVKDMGIVTAAAKSVGMAVPIAAAAEQEYLLGLSRGFGADDDSSVIRVVAPVTRSVVAPANGNAAAATLGTAPTSAPSNAAAPAGDIAAAPGNTAEPSNNTASGMAATPNPAPAAPSNIPPASRDNAPDATGHSTVAPAKTIPAPNPAPHKE